MAQVPVPTAPSVQPNGPAMPSQQIGGISETAFGVGVGQAVSQTGDVLHKHAMEMQQRINAANSTDLYVQATEQAGQLKANFNVLEGKARAEAYPKYVQDLQKIHQDYRGKAQNPEVQFMFDHDFKRRMGYDIENGASQAAAGLKQYERGAQKARQDLAFKDAAAADDASFNLALTEYGKSIATEAKSDSWSPEQLQVEKQAGIDKLWGIRFKSMALTDPQRAKELYEKNKDQISGPARIGMEHDINTGLVQIGTRIESEKIWNSARSWQEDLTSRRVGRGVRTDTLNPQFGNRLATGIKAAEEATGEKVVLSSGKRTTEEQAKLYSDFLAGRIGLAAPPGYSRHEVGEAADIQSGKALDWLRAHADEYGLEFLKDKNDPGHVQLKRGATAEADSTLATDGSDTPLTGADKLADALQQAKDAARKQFPNDPGWQQQYEDTLISRLQTRYNTDKKVLAQEKRDRYITVQSELGVKQDGTPGATAYEELSPQAKLAYNNMDGATQAKMNKAMVNNSRASPVETPQRYKNYSEVMGWRVTDPARFSEVVAGDLDVTHKRRDEIFKAQQSDIRQMRDSTKIMSALRNVQPMLNDAGIYASKENADANSKFNQFTGAFDEKLKAYEEQNKKYPTEEEQRKIAAQLLTEQSGSGYFGSNFGARQQFEVPPAFAKDATAEFRKRFNRAPTANELYRIYQKSL